MKRFSSILSVLVTLFCLTVSPAISEEPIRILLTHGGHGFEAEPFYAMFDSMQGIEYTKAEMPREADLLKPGLENDYDCIVMYDMCRPAISPQQREAFIALLNTGIGVVSLHHNLGAQAGWDEYRAIIGGQFIFSDVEIDGTAYSTTPWSHGEDLDITVVATDHPITRGVSDFSIHDETYGKYYVSPDVKVLLTTDHPKNNPQLAWTLTYGKSPVFYLMLGHDGKAYANPNYSKLIRQGIEWAAR